MNKKEPISLATQKVLFVIFFMFLILFSKYTPYDNATSNDGSTMQMIFNLYFFISNQTFGIVHEGGHGVCYLFNCPQFITTLNGTVFQLPFPLGIGYYYKRQLNIIGWYIGLFFTGFTLHYTAWYISTAHQGLHISASQSFLGQEGYHDFNYMLDAMGLLAYDNGISIAVKLIAYGVMIYAVWRMFFLAFLQTRSNRHSS